MGYKSNLDKPVTRKPYIKLKKLTGNAELNQGEKVCRTFPGEYEISFSSS